LYEGGLKTCAGVVATIGMGIEQTNFPTKTWMDRELAGCKFRDVRLEKRFRKLFEQLSTGLGESIPMVCQDWTNTKAAYRFFSNERVSEEEIFAGHFQSTRERVIAEKEPVVILHDTTEFSFKREDIDAIGRLNKGAAGKNHLGRTNYYTSCGILMHSSLAVTTEGLPLGLAAIKFWTRDKFKGTNALKRKINPTRVPIEQKESIRWLENLRQSTALLNRPERVFTLEIVRATFMSYSALRNRPGHILWCVPASIVLPERAITL